MWRKPHVSNVIFLSLILLVDTVERIREAGNGSIKPESIFPYFLLAVTPHLSYKTNVTHCCSIFCQNSWELCSFEKFTNQSIQPRAPSLPMFYCVDLSTTQDNCSLCCIRTNKRCTNASRQFSKHVNVKCIPSDSGGLCCHQMPSNQTQGLWDRCFGNTSIQALMKTFSSTEREHKPRKKRSLPVSQHPSLESFPTQKRIRVKRALLDPMQLQPRSLQIVPVKFGTFNISWTVDTESERWLSHYELVLINLNEAPSLEQQVRCKRFLQTHASLTEDSETIVHDKQLTVNISSPASYVVINGLPPDNFYRVLLFAMSENQRGPPASMPSSPRVPSLAPLTPPREVMVTTRGTQEAKVAWKPPDGAECTGELMNYLLVINSTRLLEPMRIRVAPESRSFVVRDLIPGTFYNVKISATTRGGVGVASDDVRFRTGGELPRVDLEDDEEDSPDGGVNPTDPEVDFQQNGGSFYEDVVDQNTWDLGYTSGGGDAEKYFMIPAKIQNLRAQSFPTTIHLKWSVTLRHLNQTLNRAEDTRLTASQFSTERNTPLRISLSNDDSAQERVAYLPAGTKYIIRWGDMHPGPSEDSVSGDQTQYIIRDLKPGTMYYIRVIAITSLGEGPAAYTMVMTDDSKKAEVKPHSKGLIIPVNLVVRAVGSNWARVSWELPEHPAKPLNHRNLIFQIKYQRNRRENGPSYALDEVRDQSIGIQNVSVPWVNQPSKQSKYFKATIKGLQPSTQYEFAVCWIQPSPDDALAYSKHYVSSKPTNDMCWSMVQGFETNGQSPSDPPRNIQITFPPELPPARHLDDHSPVNVSIRATPRIRWDPPSEPNGDITSYAIYWTNKRQQTLSNWMEQVVAGSVREYDLQFKLQPSQYYFLRMVSRNKHGASPFSPVLVFRTPDAGGQNGGQIRLRKVYHDARQINEPLDTLQLGSSEDGDTSRVHGSSPLSNEDQFRWIIVGSVLGGTTVCVLVALMVLCKKCYFARHVVPRVKWLPDKNHHTTLYSQGRLPIMRQNSTMENVPKVTNIKIAEACLGSSSLTGSGNGGSNAGLHVGLRTPQDVSGDSGIQCDCSVPHPKHCRCHGWAPVCRTQSHYQCNFVDSSRCHCQPDCGIQSPWIAPNVPGCWDDLQSTPAASEKEAGAGSSAGGSRVIENGLSREHSACIRAHHTNEQNTGAREMTMSYFAHHQHERADGTQIHGFKSPRFNGYGLDLSYDRSPDSNTPQTRNMIGGYFGTGSGEESTSPASSSAGRLASRQPSVSTSPGIMKYGVKIFPPHNHYPVVKIEPTSPMRNHVTVDGKQNPVYKGKNKSAYTSSMQTKAEVPDYTYHQVNTSNASSPTYLRERDTTPTGSESRAAEIGMSFALDRVPTPEPTPRPTPFSRLAAGDINQLEQNRIAIEKLKGIATATDLSFISPTLLKNRSTHISATGIEREYSAEELNQEMANLEGLMKDLNKIAANEFDC